MAVPAPQSAQTPSQVGPEDAWRYNEDADIKLLCLKIFVVSHRAFLLKQPSEPIRVGDLLPFVMDPQICTLELCIPPKHVVHADVSTVPLDATNLVLHLQGKSLPWAAINKERTRYADSVLVFSLKTSVPAVCCPKDDTALDNKREYKQVAEQHKNLLAVLIQSKHHHSATNAEGRDLSEKMGIEYRKCVASPIPFLFVLISDAKKITMKKDITLPYNGNGYFVGRNSLRQLYGDFLYDIRSESWLSREEEKEEKKSEKEREKGEEREKIIIYKARLCQEKEATSFFYFIFYTHQKPYQFLHVQY